MRQGGGCPATRTRQNRRTEKGSRGMLGKRAARIRRGGGCPAWPPTNNRRTQKGCRGWSGCAKEVAVLLPEPDRTEELKKVLGVCLEKGLLGYAEEVAVLLGRQLTTEELKKAVEGGADAPRRWLSCYPNQTEPKN